MVGWGETYVPAFALAIGMSEVAAGWVVSIPMLSGAILQLVSPWAVRTLGSNRTWVVGCATVQSLVFVFYVGAALTTAIPPFTLFAIAAVYWGSGLAAGPAWNTWVGTLVPTRIRAAYFARRSRFCQAAVLIALVSGGLALQWGKVSGHLLVVFGCLFGAAGTVRGVSVLCIASQREPEPPSHLHRTISMREWMLRYTRGSGGRLLVYMLALQVAVQISGPFFTPYMLGQLQFSYIEYLSLISMSFIAKMLVLPSVGVLVRKFGAQRMLCVGGLGVVPMSILWNVADTLPWLLFVQALGGVVWAIYELCTFLLLFDHIEEKERTSVLTTFNFFNALAIVVGSLVGGLILHRLGAHAGAYHTLFALSAVVRVASLVLLFRMRRVGYVAGDVAVRTLAVRPNLGSLDAPIVSSMTEEEREPVET